MFKSFLKYIFRYWSLERKSLLFIGLSLLISISTAFWYVQKVAEGLVQQTTRQIARDYANMVTAWHHVERREFTVRIPDVYTPDILAQLRLYLLDNPEFDAQFLMLDDATGYVDLPDSKPPATFDEQKLLGTLREKLLKHLDQNKTQAATDAKSEVQEIQTPNAELYARINPAQGDVFEELGPVFTDDAPEGGWYVYYHPIVFAESCVYCHHRTKAGTDAGFSPTPFLALKVKMPYAHGKVWSTQVMAVMITVAMVTLAVSILILHFILRKLVIRPLRHLRNVSDEISRGKYDLRANIDTDDEFSELADAFNRMLRHLTESQDRLQQLNSKLDVKVDELARANLYLYEANRLKSDFLANMSHELRTPLNSIIGFSDVLHDISSLTDKQKRYASNIQKSGRMLLEMINDILDLAKVEAGKMNVSPTSFDLGHVVLAQCDMLRSLIEEKNMDLRVEIASELTAIFQDQAKIQQILTNLLSNAIKFTPDGGVIIVSVGCIGEDWFYLTVTDTGVGIPESDFEVIFEKFRQSNSVVQGSGLTRQYSGTGLGLSIVRELCKLLGGEVRLSSQLGTGSTFRVLLPRNYTADSTAMTLSQLVATAS